MHLFLFIIGKILVYCWRDFSTLRMKIYKRIILILLLFLLSPGLRAQEVGRRFVVNFSHRQYEGESQNWAVAQDKRNLIYIANNVGVIEYDGVQWRRISINNLGARCLDVDADGRIWVGAYEEFGYLAADSNSNLVFYSLVDKLPAEYYPLGLVRQIYCDSNVTYLSTNQLVIRVNADQTLKIWPAQRQFHRSYLVDGTFFVNQKGYGLYYLNGDGLVRAKGCEQLLNSPIYTMLPYADGQILIGTQAEGFFIYDFAASQQPDCPKNLLRPFKTTNDEFFHENWVYSGVQLDANRYAIGTYRGGVAFFDSKGTIYRMESQKTGLQDNAVWNLFADKQGGLWMAFNNGVSYVPINSALSFWNEDAGLKGDPEAVARYKNHIFVGTNVGLFCLVDGDFVPLSCVNDLCWGLHVSGQGDEARLLIATTGGIVIFTRPHECEKIPTPELCLGFKESKFYENIIYVRHEHGLGILYRIGNTFKYLGRIRGTDGAVYFMEEDADGDLWYTSDYTGIGFVDMTNPYQLSSELPKIFKPFPQCQYTLPSVAQIDGKIVMTCESGLASFNMKTLDFEPDTMFGADYVNGERSLRIFEDHGNGSVWYEACQHHSPNRWIERAERLPDGTYRRERERYSLVPPTQFSCFLIEPDSVAWFAAKDALYRFDEKVKTVKTQIGQVLLRSVVANRKPVYNGISFDELPPVNCETECRNDVLELSYSHNSLSFNFALLEMTQSNRVRYSCKLEGYDSGWSDWTAQHNKEYTNLPHGSFTFRIRAKTAVSDAISETSFPFVIKRPWFVKWYAFLMYLAGMVIVSYVVSALNGRRLRINNAKLQALVNERTEEVMMNEQILLDQNQELEVQKEEILSQRDELEIRNKRLHDSIRYAKTIQQAILPNLQRELEGFGQHFLIYLPKDVVSGDFYWASQLDDGTGSCNKLLLAVVDCTGHGVPGAFMSLIGSRLLSEIVHERKFTNPASILTELSKSVKLVLQQDESSSSIDGMDLGLCLLEKKADDIVMITFAGANRSLYFCHQGDDIFQTLKGNRKSIGAVLPDVDKEFQNRYIPLHKGDFIFLSTDGIVDQNNKFGRKYSLRGLQKDLLDAIRKPMPEMERYMRKQFDEFMHGETQRDDITLLGIKF